jgi:DNA-3-methyladenine glycosylase II
MYQKTSYNNVILCMTQFTIKPVPPFDFHLSTRIFANGDSQIRRYEQEKFWQVILTNDKPTLAIVKASGTIDKPELRIILKAKGEISDIQEDTAAATVGSMFNADLDLKKFYADIRHDITLAKLSQQLRGLKSPTTPTVFEALIDSIIEQQISLAVAHSLQRKMIKTFGTPLVIANDTYYTFPTPHQLASATVDQLRQCGFEHEKGRIHS